LHIRVPLAHAHFLPFATKSTLFAPRANERERDGADGARARARSRSRRRRREALSSRLQSPTRHTHTLLLVPHAHTHIHKTHTRDTRETQRASDVLLPPPPPPPNTPRGRRRGRQTQRRHATSQDGGRARGGGGCDGGSAPGLHPIGRTSTFALRCVSNRRKEREARGREGELNSRLLPSFSSAAPPPAPMPRARRPL
jgi:hypothetical protein